MPVKTKPVEAEPANHTTAAGRAAAGVAQLAVIGGGPAGLMAADVLASASSPTAPLIVTVFDRMPTVGRKLLLAGRSGLNLTNNEPLSSLVARYGAERDTLRTSVEAFPPEALRAWVSSLGVRTFVGSSGRVFPESMRATPLLRAWLRRLDSLGVQRAPRHNWIGWGDDNTLRFEANGRIVTFQADAAVLALGGASWPRTGSDGRWVDVTRAAGIDVRELLPANSGVRVEWTSPFRERVAGAPLKNVELRVGGRTSRGDVMITTRGLEGGPVYALTPQLRERHARLSIDLRPDIPVDTLTQRLMRGRAKDSMANTLRKVGLTPIAIDLLRACATVLPTDAGQLAARLKSVPVATEGVEGLARAISTAGGIAFAALDNRLMIRGRPGTFVAGEMLDWEAPTGGYLLQACFSTGVHAARGALAYLDRNRLA